MNAFPELTKNWFSVWFTFNHMSCRSYRIPFLILWLAFNKYTNVVTETLLNHSGFTFNNYDSVSNGNLVHPSADIGHTRSCIERKPFKLGLFSTTTIPYLTSSF